MNQRYIPSVGRTLTLLNNPKLLQNYLTHPHLVGGNTLAYPTSPPNNLARNDVERETYKIMLHPVHRLCLETLLDAFPLGKTRTVYAEYVLEGQ